MKMRKTAVNLFWKKMVHDIELKTNCEYFIQNVIHIVKSENWVFLKLNKDIWSPILTGMLEYREKN